MRNRLNHHFAKALKFFALACACAVGMAGILAAALGLTGCAATEQLPATRADTILTAAGMKSVGKLVIRGNVIYQAGTGNTATVTGKDKTGQRAQAVTTGANSPVTASQKKGGLPWWVLLLVGVGSVVGWEYLSHQLNPLGWLPWRARPG